MCFIRYFLNEKWILAKIFRQKKTRKEKKKWNPWKEQLKFNAKQKSLQRSKFTKQNGNEKNKNRTSEERDIFE